MYSTFVLDEYKNRKFVCGKGTFLDSERKYKTFLKIYFLSYLILYRLKNIITYGDPDWILVKSSSDLTKYPNYREFIHNTYFSCPAYIRLGKYGQIIVAIVFADDGSLYLYMSKGYVCLIQKELKEKNMYDGLDQFTPQCAYWLLNFRDISDYDLKANKTSRLVNYIMINLFTRLRSYVTHLKTEDFRTFTVMDYTLNFFARHALKVRLNEESANAL